MTVGDLIEKLKKYDQNLPICIIDEEIDAYFGEWTNIYYEIVSVKMIEDSYCNADGNYMLDNFVGVGI